MNLATAPKRASQTNATVKVLVVDDSAVVRGLTRRFLEENSNIKVVATASNGKNAVEAVKQHSLDVVVLDIEMPVMDDLTAIPLILAAKPKIKIVMSSTLRTTSISFSTACKRKRAFTHSMSIAKLQPPG